MNLVKICRDIYTVKKTQNTSWNELKPMVISHLNHYFENNKDPILKAELKTEKAKLRALGVSDHVLRNIEIVGFLPQGNDEPSTKIISLTNTQKLV